VAAVILTATLALSASSQQQVPLKGTLQGHDADIAFTDTSVTVETNGTGISTLMGQFSFHLLNTVDFLTSTSTGNAQFVAANGDSFNATVMGAGEQVGELISITEIYTITGGTGRFANARGSFTVERLASPTTFLTSGSFHGVMTNPGTAR